MRKANHVVLLLAALAIFLSACGTTAGPAGAVEDYLGALAAKDAARLSTLSCPLWAESALLEMNSFQAVTVSLEGLTCHESGMDGAFTLVTCEGNLVTSYNGENQTIDISLRTYQVVEEGGEYLVCGYR